MKRVVVGIVLFASGAAHLVASDTSLPSKTAIPSSASGQGSIRFGEHGAGVGTFVFNVEQGAGVTGSLVFAAEDHHDYPDIIVRVDNIEGAAFELRSVSFSGAGKLHDDPVSVSVSAFDGKGVRAPDTFAIECTNSQGEVVFEAQGEVFIGDVRVGETG